MPIYKLKVFFKNILLYFVLAAVTPALFSSCDDSFIYENEDDCNPYYKVKFSYDWNLKFADAFQNEVNEVSLYLVDADGKVVWSKREAGETVKADGYMMDVDVQPGTYTLLAWAGEGHKSHFEIPESLIAGELSSSLLRDRSPEGVAESSRLLKDLYHGLKYDLVFPDEEGIHVFKLPLIKDTNHVTVVLQHLSGERVESDKFRFEITADNGLMDWDNGLLEDEMITYRPYRLEEGTAGIIKEDVYQSGRAIESVSAAVASFTMSRLVEDKDVRISVFNKETGKRVFSIPLIDYAVLVKGKYGSMGNQEYLDRQDDYNMTFFLDENDDWMSAYIYINSWKVMLQHSSL